LATVSRPRPTARHRWLRPSGRRPVVAVAAVAARVARRARRGRRPGPRGWGRGAPRLARERRRTRPARRAPTARAVPRRARRHGHHGDPRGGRPGRIRPVLRLHLRRGATPRTLETAAAGKDLFLLPQAAPLEACGAKPGHTSDADLAAFQWDHLDLARRHP